MLDSIVRYTDDTSGLEKTLRLFQGFCTIAAGLAVTPIDADYWAKTRGQFALGRRYFRLLKWYPAFVNARKAVSGERSSMYTILDTIKWSFLGLYLFLEMFTITNAMGVTAFEWGPRVQLEANKCWFYSLTASILLSLVELMWLHILNTSPSTSSREEKDRGFDKPKTGISPTKEMRPTTARSKIYVQLVIDCCDLLLPGSAVGWSPTALASPLVVGTASTISTTVSGRQIWRRVQQSAPQP